MPESIDNQPEVESRAPSPVITPADIADNGVVVNVTFCTNSVSRLGGGVTPAVRELARALAAHGVKVRVSALLDRHTATDRAQWEPLAVDTAPVAGPRTLEFAPRMRNQLLRSRCTLYHRHGLWTYPSWAVARAARRNDCPYVVSVHGMLNRPALRVSPLRKRVAGRLFERRFLNEAACVHALSEAEAHACRDYGVSSPIAIIPNGIEPVAPAPETTSPWPADRRVLLYLGRLHPIKGLPDLIAAFGAQAARAAAGNWHLVLAGPDQNNHRRTLESQVAALGIGERILFAGPVHGAEKDAMLQHCSTLVLPSTSEAHAVAVLEAWSHGRPVLVTEACGLPFVEAEGIGLSASGSGAALSEALARLFDLADHERGAMGRRARAYVSAHYRWDEAARKMAGVYRWITGAGECPSWVLPATDQRGSACA